MQAFRILALVLIAAGLLIQSAAYAAVPAAPPAESATHCTEMATAEQAPANEEGNEPCCDMTLGCLVAMNCIASLFPPAATGTDLPVRCNEANYLALTVAWMHVPAAGPEPPPPQSFS